MKARVSVGDSVSVGENMSVWARAFSSWREREHEAEARVKVCVKVR